MSAKSGQRGYAHFSPVGLINDRDILQTKDFNDALGNESIWQRIKKTGEGTFYRVVYKKRMTEEEKREKAEDYIEKDANTKKLLINTSIADTDYINNVIKAYVHGDKNAGEQLYKEPDKEE